MKIKHRHLHPDVKIAVKRAINERDKAETKRRGVVWTCSLVVFSQAPHVIDSPLVTAIRKSGLLASRHAESYRLPPLTELADTHHGLVVKPNGDIHIYPH